MKGFDWSSIRHFKRVGVNCAFDHNPEVCCFIDQRVPELYVKNGEYYKSSTIKLIDQGAQPALNWLEKKCKNTAWLRKNDSRVRWPSTINGPYRIPNNTGFYGIQVADMLGGNPIFLLGFDMKGKPGIGHNSKKPVKNAPANWHNHYPRDWMGDETPFDKWIKELNKFHDLVRGQVYNCNPDSALECFPKITAECGIRMAWSHYVPIAEGKRKTLMKGPDDGKATARAVLGDVQAVASST